jgi:glycosyltransferase involved in cell wall biosynthesis
MKIAFIDVTVTHSFGGIQTAIWQLAEELTHLGHDVHVFGGIKDSQQVLEKPNVKIHTFPYISRHQFPNFGTRFRKLAERVSFTYYARSSFIQEQFDWAILTKPFDFIWPALVKSKCATKFAFMSGGTDFCLGDRSLGQNISAWLACSHFNAWQLHQHYKKFPHVMFNGVNTSHFTPHDGQEKRHELGIHPEDIVFGFAGRLIGWKGLDYALHALTKLPSSLPAKLLFIGDGPAKNQLVMLAKQHQITDRVIFHPAVPHQELPHYLAATDVGIFPSIGDEAFGISIAEAMSCGKPVIASHLGGIPEVVGNQGTCGLLWPAGHVDNLTEKMAWMINNPDQRMLLGAAARQRVLNHFQWCQSAQALLKVLR